MTFSPFDPCFCFPLYSGQLAGVIGLATDNSINTGISTLTGKASKAKSIIISKNNKVAEMNFLGLEIHNQQSKLSVLQTDHIKRLKVLDKSPWIKITLDISVNSSYPLRKPLHLTASTLLLPSVKFRTKKLRLFTSRPSMAFWFNWKILSLFL